MFKGKRSRKSGEEGESSSRYNENVEEINMNDFKNDTMRSRNTPTDDKNGSSEFYEDAGRVYSRSGQSGSIGDVVDDTPKLHRGLKARHVGFFLFWFESHRSNFFVYLVNHDLFGWYNRYRFVFGFWCFRGQCRSGRCLNRLFIDWCYGFLYDGMFR